MTKDLCSIPEIFLYYKLHVDPNLKLFCLNSLPDDKNLDWSKLKQIADHILKFI